MPKRQRPTGDDAREALRLLLSGLSGGDDLEAMARAVAPLHPPRNTFPGEVFVRLGAEALDEAGADRERPVAYDELRGKYLADAAYRGWGHRKIQHALLVTAAWRGGVEPDLLDVVWATDDFWRYALDAAVACIRAAADRLGVPVAGVCALLAARHDLDLPGLER